MQTIQSRRDFLTSTSLAAASVLAARRSLADERPPEVTTIRLRRDPSICVAPWYIAEDLLRAEGFTDVRYVPAQEGDQSAQMIAGGEIDFSLYFVGSLIYRLDEGSPITALAGVHSGCFELFAHEPIRTISDLKGKRVGISVLGGAKHRYVAIMAAQVGLDPHQDIEWVEGSALDPVGLFPMDLFIERKVDAFLGFPPEPQELRARKIGRVILDTTTDKPCRPQGQRDLRRAAGARRQATGRARLRAELRLRMANPGRASVRQLARVRR